MNEKYSPYIDFSSFLSESSELNALLVKDSNSFNSNFKNTQNILDIAKCKQIHSTNVKYVLSSGIYENCDGLITSLESKFFLQISTADCTPIFMYDPIMKIIGLIHSGWKGTANKIILNALNIFLKRGSKSKNIKIALGPSIKECCFEVQKDVASLFDDKYIIISESRLYINLSLKIFDDLVLNGLMEDNIYVSKSCTFDDSNFQSYRREGKESGRMISLIGNTY